MTRDLPRADLLLRPVKRLRRRVLPWYQHAVRQAHELRYLFLELTQRCDLACLHCGSDCSHDPAMPELPFDDALRVMDEIRQAYDARRITVVLSGGEPLRYERVFELGARLRGMGFPWGMVTNGQSWNQVALRNAERAGMATITVSLDGMEAEHDWLRGRAGAQRRALWTIRQLLAHPCWQKMDVITCVNQRNLDQLDALQRLLSSLGVPGWRLFTISPIGRALSQPELFLDEAGFKRLQREIIALRARGGMRIEYVESGYLGPCLERRTRDREHFCLAGIRVGGVMANGDILACPNIDRRLRQGNIHRDSFVQVWEQRYQRFRDRRWMRVGECAQCDEWRWCQGNALHNWDLDANRPRICEFREFDLGSL